MMKSLKVEKIKRGILLYATFLTLYLFLFTSCKQEDETIVSQPHEEEFTVAVVAPIGDAATKLRLERTAQWFAENFLQAQQSDTLLYSLLIEWHDEQHEDLATLSRELARRDDIVAIVGPFGNEPAAQFAAACQQTHKPLIAPTATSEELSDRAEFNDMDYNYPYTD